MRTAKLTTTRLSPQVQEQMFQDAMREWVDTSSKQSWDSMFTRVYEFCKAMALTKAPGKPFLEDRAMDATITIMDRIRRGARPNRLSSYCYWPLIGAIQGDKAKREDRELSYESYETYEYANNIV